MSTKKEFGDFQTPEELAVEVVALVTEIFGIPEAVIEPTSGLGAFFKASVHQWGQLPRYEGYEINQKYIETASKSLSRLGVKLYHRDFFTENWRENLSRHKERRIFVLGNPPWVTNSDLASMGSGNLPQKTNFQGLRGLDALTGKSNFDIAEWMLIRLIEALPAQGVLAMLCKTATARKVLRHFWKTDGGREGSRLFRIDAKMSFDVAVDACLFVTTGKITSERTADIHSSLDFNSQSTRFGYVDGAIVSDLEAYSRLRKFAGVTYSHTWRSGIKHDAASVMELTSEGTRFRNGLGELVELEDNFIYPLLKSSDLGNNRIDARKHVLVTQTHTGEDTSVIASEAPKTWAYLLRHAETLDRRKSSIYQNRSRFSVFGVGDYSFALWKVAISGLYKSFNFVVVPPRKGRPVLVDDTCYSIPCESEDEARFLCELLSSDQALEFLRSLAFEDSKRPVTIDVLRKLSLAEIARHLGRLDELEQFTRAASHNGNKDEHQMLLLMEDQQKYRTKPGRRVRPRG